MNLQECEKVLEEHRTAFVRVGLALKEIRDDRLYEVDGFKTFEEFARNWYDMPPRKAHELIELAVLHESLPTARWTEAHVRQFNRLDTTGQARRVASQALAEETAP